MNISVLTSLWNVNCSVVILFFSEEGQNRDIWCIWNIHFQRSRRIFQFCCFSVISNFCSDHSVSKSAAAGYWLAELCCFLKFSLGSVSSRGKKKKNSPWRIVDSDCWIWWSNLKVIKYSFNHDMGESGNSYVPVSHWLPVYPVGHWQMKPLIWSSQVPPFWHGLEAHSSTSRETGRNTEDVVRLF